MALETTWSPRPCIAIADEENELDDDDEEEDDEEEPPIAF